MQTISVCVLYVCSDDLGMIKHAGFIRKFAAFFCSSGELWGAYT